MSKKQPGDQVCDSHDVIRKYIDFVESCGGDPGHHLARVSVSNHASDKIKGKVLEVGVIIESNYSKVIICGDSEFYSDYHSEYTNIYQVFQSYAAGTLRICDTEDRYGNSVVIELSYYK